jgi:hypothetical protein
VRKVQVCAVWILVSGLSAVAQQGKAVPLAPVPVQIAAAKKVFISNAGGQSFETVFEQIVFNGGPDRPYNEFYAAMKNRGHYEIVSSPADADLVLAIRWVLSDTGLKLPSYWRSTSRHTGPEKRRHPVEPSRICAGRGPAGKPGQEFRSCHEHDRGPHPETGGASGRHGRACEVGSPAGGRFTEEGIIIS